MILAWHVDYWDRLGWKDPFGAKAHTKRQRDLSKARKLKNVWTPMLCVDGAPVRGDGFRDAFEDARVKESRFRAVIEAQAGVAARIRLEGKAELPAKAELRAVLFQERATTACTAGENKGRTLEEYFVVRAVSDPLDCEAARKKGVTATFKAPEGVKPGNLGIAFLLEDPAAMKTIDCWWTPLGKPDGKDADGKKGEKDAKGG